jgi:3-methyladenine DNA glycosylase AlkC
MSTKSMASQNKGTGFSLKDELFNRKRVQYLAQLFHGADDSFNAAGFVRDTMTQLQKLELKERIVHIACVLEDYLAPDYRTAVRQIAAALPPPLDPAQSDNDFGDFIFAPLGEFVVRNGLAKQHVTLSLATLKKITMRFSMEDAIRTFIDTHTDRTLQELQKWSTARNYHVRRLVSEGTRPRLPWSGRLSIAAETPLPLLETLHADGTRYVTRSVANHLNDISKTNPQLVLDTLTRWKRKGEQDESELNWINRHALRSLVKQGHARALRFLGFRPDPHISVDEFVVNPTHIKPGQAIEFSFAVTARRDESLIVDYVIDFVKASGKLSPKVHKLKQMTLQKGESVTLNKRHVLRANATTYTLYPGTHHLTLQINGKAFGKRSFQLL